MPINEQNNQTCVEHAKAFKDSTLECIAESFTKIFLHKDLKENFNTDLMPITFSDSGLEDAFKFVNIAFNLYIVSLNLI